MDFQFLFLIIPAGSKDKFLARHNGHRPARKRFTLQVRAGLQLSRSVFGTLVSTDGGETISHMSCARAIPSGLTGKSRLVLSRTEKVHQLPVPLLLQRMGVPPSTLEQTQLLNKENSRALLVALEHEFPPALDVLIAKAEYASNARATAAPKDAKRDVALSNYQLETDALRLACAASGLDNILPIIEDMSSPPSKNGPVRPLVPYLSRQHKPTNESPPESVVEVPGPGERRNIREDLQILTDQSAVAMFGEEWQELKRLPYFGAVIISDKRRTLRVIYANQQPLEESFGADLIYENIDENLICCVQYKRLRQNIGRNSYPIDNQMRTQVDTMHTWLRALPSYSANTSDECRLSSNPFYFKFCEKFQHMSLPTEPVHGYYQTLEQVQIHTSSNEPIRIGQRASKYLSNGQFGDLLKRGWIGASGASATHLRTLVDQVLRTGRSVTFAQLKLEPLRDQE